MRVASSGSTGGSAAARRRGGGASSGAGAASRRSFPEEEEAAAPPSWVFGRSLCCLGLAVLLHNALLLRWCVSVRGRCASTAQLPLHPSQLPQEAVSHATLASTASFSEAPSSGIPTAQVPLSAARSLRSQAGNSVAQTAPALPAPAASPMPPAPLLSALTASPTAAPTAVLPATAAASGRAMVENQPLDNAVEEMATVAAVAPGLSGAVAATGASRRLREDSSLLSVPRQELRLFGKPPPASVEICVGFGSVKRKKDYVLDTVSTMLGLKGGDVVLSDAERKSIVIVAHLADFDTVWVDTIAGKLKEEYKDLVDAGHFHALHAPQERYPPLEVCPPLCSYKDEPKRVKWRAKQNVDYAFLMYYAAPLAKYYLQMEDDISFASSWISKMSTFVKTQQNTQPNIPWRLIDFSQLGFIGKMFQSNELTRMAQFLLLYYDQMPCDLLLGEWMRAMGQSRRIEYWKQRTALFQHVGVFRTLGGFQPLQERSFGKLLFNNPPGTFYTNFTLVPTYEAKFIYFPGGEPKNRQDNCDFKASQASHKARMKRCWLWVKKPSIGSHATLVFEYPVPLKAVFVEFGTDQHQKDVLLDGAIQVADTSAGASQGRRGISVGETACGPFLPLVPVDGARMVYWEENASEPAKAPVPKVRCLRIATKKDQDSWMAIWQVLIRSQ
eukprot:TRINITY_DN9397_c0_g5_i1.p1 TRINITY_DN9397_c0_g5~~TRINITY_DN9397_c0_g5_i1.p1  ORF type:complete len:724 (+),score=142.22 TRINITY_DN9397_c0_g5_i1:163-2172(+)